MQGYPDSRYQLRELIVGDVDSNYGGNQVTIKIIEAVAEDMRSGNFNNAAAGKFLIFWKSYPSNLNPKIYISGQTLSTNIPGLENDPRTQQGPTTISKDGQKIEYRPPLPRQWANLHSTWSMAFLTSSKHNNAWPYLIVKQLIPSVSPYVISKL